MTPQQAQLTDEQVVRVLALRNGFTEVYDWKPGYGTLNDRICYVCIPPYLASHDALAPVLAGLSEVEWNELTPRLHRQSMAGIHSSPALSYRKLTSYLLTLPPADLARAVASVLVASTTPP